MARILIILLIINAPSSFGQLPRDTIRMKLKGGISGTSGGSTDTTSLSNRITQSRLSSLLVTGTTTKTVTATLTDGTPISTTFTDLQGSSDGNNYPTLLTYNSGTLTLGRSGLSDLTATIPVSSGTSQAVTDTLTSHNTRILANTSSIAANTSSIATNTTNITANTTAIAGKVDNVKYTTDSTATKKLLDLKQASLASNSFVLQVPGNNAVNTIGHVGTTTGTVSTPALSSSTLIGSIRRVKITSAATTAATASTSTNNGVMFPLNGFTWTARMAWTTVTPTAYGFAGAIFGNSATTSSVFYTNIIGFGFGSGATNMSVLYNDGTGSPTAIDLGANFPISSTAVYDLVIKTVPNSNVYTYYVHRLDVEFEASGTISDPNVPGAATLLTPMIRIGNNTDASAVSIDVAKMYVESTY